MLTNVEPKNLVVKCHRILLSVRLNPEDNISCLMLNMQTKSWHVQFLGHFLIFHSHR